jgi:hypothetical protein
LEQGDYSGRLSGILMPGVMESDRDIPRQNW